jgi:DNA repair protein RadC
MNQTKDKLDIFKKKLQNVEQKTGLILQDEKPINIIFEEEKLFADEISFENALEDEKLPPVKAAAQKKPIHHGVGHRERVRERLLTGNEDGDGILDSDLVEMILFFDPARARIDVKALARKIIDKFQNLNNFLDASPHELKEYFQDRNTIPFLLKLIKVINARRYKNKIQKSKNIISNWSFLLEYLRNQIGLLNHEELRAIYLDSSYRLILDVSLGTGTVDEITIYIRSILKKAIECHAKFLIIGHNHPSGIAEPSKEDIKMTNDIQSALKGIDIILLDHLIITADKEKYFSFKANFLLN